MERGVERPLVDPEHLPRGLPDVEALPVRGREGLLRARADQVKPRLAARSVRSGRAAGDTVEAEQSVGPRTRVGGE
jgi:hypothetical protein